MSAQDLVGTRTSILRRAVRGARTAFAVATAAAVALGLCCVVTGALEPCPAIAAQPEGIPFADPSLGIAATLPDATWHCLDRSQGPVRVFMFLSNAAPESRFVVMVFPLALGLRSMEAREAQIKGAVGAAYEQLGTGAFQVTPDGQQKLASESLDYRITGAGRGREVGFALGDFYYVLQAWGPEKEWEDGLSTQATVFFESFRLLPRPPAPPPADESQTPGPAPAPAEPGEAPPQSAFDTGLRVARHSIQIEIDPSTGRFTGRDTVRFECVAESAETAAVFLGDFKIDRIVEAETGRALEYTEEPAGQMVKLVTVTLAEPLTAGRTTDVTFSYSCENYIFLAEQSPIPNYVVMGQVTPQSSYSSHVLYYPVDQRNDAPGLVSITVPEGFTAISCGELVRVTHTRYEDEAGRERKPPTVTYHWSTEQTWPRILPFGFAAARYPATGHEDVGGLPVWVYGFEGEEDKVRARLGVAVDAARFFSEALGPLPFEKIAIAHVKPVEGLAGVSLPTLILFSDEFFLADPSYELIAKDVSLSFTGPLVVVDEVSHQWNAYTVAFPNVLAEGMAQYADTMFAEHVAGLGKAGLPAGQQSAAAVRKMHADFYDATYKATVAYRPDAPIMADSVYQTPAYMAVVFCKGARVLDMLRHLVGDEVYFAGMREVFQSLRGKVATLDDLRACMERHARADLAWFFDQWYKRPGYPRLEAAMTFEGPRPDGLYDAILTVRQAQATRGADGGPAKPESLYRLPVDLKVTYEGGELLLERLWVSEETHTFSATVPGKPLAVVVDPDNEVLD